MKILCKFPNKPVSIFELYHQHTIHQPTTVLNLLDSEQKFYGAIEIKLRVKQQGKQNRRKKNAEPGKRYFSLSDRTFQEGYTHS